MFKNTVVSIVVFYFSFMTIHQYRNQLFAATKWESYYSIQVKAFPRGELENAISLYKDLKHKGYLVYYYQTQVKGKWWVRIKMGCFSKKTDAIDFGNNIKEEQGLDFFVTQGNILVEDFQGKFKIITTPSGIWLQSDSTNEEIFTFSQKLFNVGILSETKALISPSGKEIVFYYQNKIMKIDVNNKNIIILKEGDLWRSSPKWSPDGQYIAYMDLLEWEARTNLWIIKSDRSRDTCIVSMSNFSEEQVKSFSWHPIKNNILYIQGYAFGTPSGGDLFITDIFGNKFLAAKTEPKSILKIFGFRVEDDGVNLSLAQFREGKLFPLKKRLHKKIPFEKLYKGVTITPETLNLK